MDEFDELPVRWDITMHRAAVWEYTGRIEDPDGLIDTSGYAMEFTIKESLEDSAPVIATFTTANGAVLTGLRTDSEGEQVNWWIRVSGLATANIPAGVYWHNIWITPPGGASDRQCYFAGACCVEQEVRS